MRFVAALRQRIYVSRGRVLLRRAGMLRVLHLIGAMRLPGARFEDDPGPLELATVCVGEFTASFSVSSAVELQRARTLNGERKVLLRLLREVRPGDVVFDIGTNCGLYTIFLAKAVGETGSVIGFEPESRSFQKCAVNLGLNSLKNVRMFERALADEEKEVSLVVDEKCVSGVHHMLRDGEDVAPSHLQSIRVVPGDQLIAEESLPVPNVLKVDVEGMEEEVLQGLVGTLGRPECRLLLCEVHFAILDGMGRWDAPRRILRFLAGCGFGRIEWLNAGHLVAFKQASGE